MSLHFHWFLSMIHPLPVMYTRNIKMQKTLELEASHWHSETTLDEVLGQPFGVLSLEANLSKNSLT